MFHLLDLALRPMNKMINTALQMDPETVDKMVPFAGKVLAIELTGINQIMYVYILVDGLRLSFSYQGEVQTTLIGTPLAFVRLLLQTQLKTLSNDIKINGDPHFAQQLQIMLINLNIDWEEQLSKLVGDNASYYLGRAGKDIQQWVSNTLESMRINTTEYLQIETQQLPTRHEVEFFLREVDVLRNDVERVSARIKKLSPT